MAASGPEAGLRRSRHGVRQWPEADRRLRTIAGKWRTLVEWWSHGTVPWQRTFVVSDLYLADRCEASCRRVGIVLAAQWETAGKIGLAIRLTENDESAALRGCAPLAEHDVRARLELEAVAAVFVGIMIYFSSGILVCSVGAVNLECR